ncbi:protein LSM12, partial [Lecanoromycetidae sp. Uapishka_2]
MAERNKGANAGGKAPIATPKSPQATASPALSSLEDALSGAIGASVRIQTTNPTQRAIEGTIFTVDLNSNILVTSHNSTPTTTSYRLIPIWTIKDFQLTKSSSAPQSTAALPSISTEAIMARANAALAKEKEKAAKLNANVPKEAQDLFVAIGRQLPTRWNGNDIVVMDQVIMKGPGYGSGDCRAAKNAAPGTLERVRKVVDNERKKLAQKDGKGPKPVVPAVPAIPAFSGGQRKGG